MTATFTSRFSAVPAPLKHAWENTVGSGHTLLALHADWQEQFRRCRDELGFRHLRFHGLLMDDPNTLTAQGKPFYSFFNSDRIFDFLLSIGMRPIVELDFMPEILIQRDQTIFHFRGDIGPPVNAWVTLVRKLVGHWVDRYGIAEVSRWFFEVSHEPNLPALWTGTRDGYFTFYGCTAQAVKSVDESLRVGGPTMITAAWMDELVDLAARTPLPVDPRDHYHDEPFVAGCAVKIALETYPSADGHGYWSFNDIFEENYFPSICFHGRFGLFNRYGVPKPLYRAFQLLHALGTERLAVAGTHETVDAWIVRKSGAITTLLSNYTGPNHHLTPQLVDVCITDAPAPLAAHIERIDENHANPRRLRREMGALEYPGRLQMDQLEAASRLVKEPLGFSYADRSVRFHLDLPPQAVAAVTLELATESLESGRCT